MPITVAELKRRLQNLPKNQIPAVVEGMEKAASRIENSAKRECPVDTGNLRNGIFHEVFVEEGRVIGFVGDPVEYARPVHDGHRTRMGQAMATTLAKYGGGGGGWVCPNPFILNPIIEHRQDTLEDLAEAQHETLEEAAR